MYKYRIYVKFSDVVTKNTNYYRMPSQVENVVKLPPWSKYVKLVKRTSDYREWPWKIVYKD